MPEPVEIGQRTAAAHDDGRARVFAVLWALAHLMHLLSRAGGEIVGDAVTDPTTWLVLGGALVAMTRPAASWALATLATTQLLHLGAGLPVVDNHWLIVGVVNAALLLSMAAQWRRSKGWDGHAALRRVLPFTRLALIVCYGAAAVAKLNAGFFDPDHSCAVSMFQNAVMPFGDWAGPTGALPWIIAGAELSIPLMLALPRTRAAGIALAVVFHLLISLSPTVPGLAFTFVLFALLFTFLPARVGRMLINEAADLARRRRFLRMLASPGVRAAAALLFIALVGGRGALLGPGMFFLVRWALLAFVAVVVGTILLMLAWRSRGVDVRAETPVTGLEAAHAVLIVLIVLNAAAPYLGGKTTTAFTMYSNLQTEQGESNHFVLPRLAVATAQDDLVEVIDSSNEWLEWLSTEGLLISWHELRRTLADDPEASVRYRRGGRVIGHAQAAEDPELTSTHPILHRVVIHRPVDPAGPRCLW